jgi:hypothetical protein
MRVMGASLLHGGMMTGARVPDMVEFANNNYGRPVSRRKDEWKGT